MPDDQAKSWLLRLFDSEQRYWIEMIRDNKNMTIGKVIQQSLISREAIWTQPVVPNPVRDRQAVRDADPPTRRRQEREQKQEFDPKNFCSGSNRGKRPRGDKCRYTRRCDRKMGDAPLLQRPPPREGA